MPKITMLIRTRAGSELEVLKEVKTIEGVEDASIGFDGEIFAVVSAEDMDKLKEITTWKIRTIANITGTTIKLADESNTNVTNETPSNPLVASTERLRDIPDETYEKLIEVVMTNFFSNWHQFKYEEIARETGTSKEPVQSTLIFLKEIVWRNLAGELSISSLQGMLLNGGKYSQSKVDILTKQFEKNKNDLRFTLMFNLVKNLSNKMEATSKSFEYIKVIATHLEELKGLYGHVLDVCASTREDVNKLTELVLSENKDKEELKKKKLW